MAGNRSVPPGRHLVQPVHAGGGLLGHALDRRRPAAVHLPGVGLQRAGQHAEERPATPRRRRRPGIGHRARGLELGALVHQHAWRRRRRPGSCSGPARPARSAPARCTTSTPPASRPSRRTPGCPAGRRRCRPGPTAMAAAAWSWVEKMLQDAQRTCAPSATRVSISTAVCTVMCSEPVIRAPVSGRSCAHSLADGHQAGHLVLGQPDLPAAEVRQGQVGDLERNGFGRHARSSGLRLVRDGRRAGVRRMGPREAAPPTYGTAAAPRTPKAAVPDKRMLNSAPCASPRRRRRWAPRPGCCATASPWACSRRSSPARAAGRPPGHGRAAAGGAARAPAVHRRRPGRGGARAGHRAAVRHQPGGAGVRRSGCWPTRGSGPRSPSWAGASAGSSRCPPARWTSSRNGRCACSALDPPRR